MKDRVDFNGEGVLGALNHLTECFRGLLKLVKLTAFLLALEQRQDKQNDSLDGDSHIFVGDG